MKLKIGKLLGGIARKAKENPEVALMLLGLAAPKVAAKVAKAAPVIVAVAKGTKG